SGDLSMGSPITAPMKLLCPVTSRVRASSDPFSMRCGLTKRAMSREAWAIGAVPHRVMVHVKVAGALWLPAASRASTENVWLVELRPEYPCGLEQALNAPPSSWHWKVTPASASVNLNWAFFWLVVLAGADVIVGVGGALVSTTMVQV